MPTSLDEVQSRSPLGQHRVFMPCSEILRALSRIAPRTLAEIGLMFAKSSTAHHNFSDAEIKNCLAEQIKKGVVVQVGEGFKLK